jgi:hypothetical protein
MLWTSERNTRAATNTVPFSDQRNGESKLEQEPGMGSEAALALPQNSWLQLQSSAPRWAAEPATQIGPESTSIGSCMHKML